MIFPDLTSEKNQEYQENQENGDLWCLTQDSGHGSSWLEFVIKFLCLIDNKRTVVPFS